MSPTNSRSVNNERNFKPILSPNLLQWARQPVLRVPMDEASRALDHFVDRMLDKRCCKRQIPARESLAQNNNIGNEVTLGLERKVGTRAAVPAHNLVEEKKHSIFVTNTAHALK
ncbi:hypothetical protein MY5147_010007, partial [Beauveria neobassiana]